MLKAHFILGLMLGTRDAMMNENTQSWRSRSLKSVTETKKKIENIYRTDSNVPQEPNEGK